ncbi:MAG: hypothetical protein K0Q66_1709 [Chitinophagaceae bacterium]|nr:hypothetical protein [Chitinophagaceae bacterium]
MSEIVFSYKGIQHSGYIVSSTNIEPHYHWFYFNSEEIGRLLHDDCIGFKLHKNQLLPTKQFIAHSDLVETVKHIVARSIKIS